MAILSDYPTKKHRRWGLGIRLERTKPETRKLKGGRKIKKK
ncbi:MAG: hypothetical protein ACPLW9_01405 [Minisyncoccales bacterium]